MRDRLELFFLHNYKRLRIQVARLISHFDLMPPWFEYRKSVNAFIVNLKCLAAPTRLV